MKRAASNAPITTDFANCLADRIAPPHGLPSNLIEQSQNKLAQLTEQLNQSRGTGWERWRNLPFDPMRREHTRAVNTLIKKLRPRTQNLIVLGIGGSALGNIALHNALKPVTHNLIPHRQRKGPRLFVLDNVDPHLVRDTFEEVKRDDPRFARTIVNVISKSGETAETAAQFLIARDMLQRALGKKSYAKHIIAITDPVKGTMREICDREGYTTLPVPEGVGGRFSVLSPVGLFSAAMCGINIEQLLDGAAAMDARCADTNAMKNPAATLALLLLEFTKRGKSIHVMMPYCNALYSLADWYRQLWAESLGKRINKRGEEVFAGATPVKALGTTDQHSQVQLYREGPNDKVFGFVEVEKFDRDIKIPRMNRQFEISNLKYLAGKTLSELLHAEKRATEFALVESQRPNYTIRLPRLSAHAVGQFIQLWEVVTAYAGLMLDIDAYDQPAVETGKVATFGLMGRAGYDEWKARVNDTLKPTEYVV